MATISYMAMARLSVLTAVCPNQTLLCCSTMEQAFSDLSALMAKAQVGWFRCSASHAARAAFGQKLVPGQPSTQLVSTV